MRGLLLAGTVSLLAADGAWAASACVGACREDAACAASVEAWQEDADSVRGAIDKLKEQRKRHPADPVLVRCLASAYLADDNPFWAVRILRDATDCESRSWLAFAFLSQGFVDDADETLQGAGCPETAPDRSRWLLMQALVARARNDPGAADAAIGDVGAAGILYPEDEGMWHHLRGGRPQPAVRLHLDLSGGYTSNTAAGSPTDPDFEGPGSGFGHLDFSGQLVWPTPWRLQPAVELGVRGLGFPGHAAGDLSYLQLTTRPGAVLTLGSVKALVGYRLDFLTIDQEDVPWFAVGHRGEVEVEIGDWLLFGGAGHRKFHEEIRSRVELDLGAGGTLAAWRRVRFLMMGSARTHVADDDNYDLLGATLQGVSWLKLPADMLARLGLSGGADWYLHSGGPSGLETFGIEEERFELFARISAGLWSPASSGVRLGVTYDLAWRDSTADLPARNYDYVEHRVLVTLRLWLSLDPWSPGIDRSASHVPLPYGVAGTQGGLDEERIQDLLRRDEADRRGACGCGS